MAGWTSKHKDNFKLKKCDNCNIEFKPKSGIHKYCSEKCKGAYKYISGSVTTETQYEKINKSWRRYLQRILYCRKRKNKITVDELLSILEKQKYLCALSGVPLTGYLEKGKTIKTNASIDRIVAGGEYSVNNVQLVCVALNKYRCDTELKEFIDWCKKVAKHNE